MGGRFIIAILPKISSCVLTMPYTNVSRYLEKGSQPDWQTYKGSNSLHLAAQQGHTDIVKLLSALVDNDEKNNEGMSKEILENSETYISVFSIKENNC